MKREPIVAVEHFVRLSPSEFEQVVGRSLVAQGYEVSHVGGRGDQGIDLIGKRAGSVLAVQCKRYKTVAVTPNQVREFLGAMVAARASSGVLVTTSVFTHAARMAVEGQAIEFVDGPSLTAWLTQGRSKRIPQCSRCERIAGRLSEWTLAWICGVCGEYNSIS